MRNTYFIDNSKTIQRRLLSIEPTSRKRTLRKHVSRNWVSYLMFSIIVVFSLITVVLGAVTKFSLNGYSSEGTASAPNLITGTTEATDLGHILGTDSLGRDNWSRYLGSFLHFILFPLFVVAIGIILAIVTSTLFYNWKRFHRIAAFFRKIEGLVFLPILLVFITIISPTYISFLFCASIPFSISFFSEFTDRRIREMNKNYRQQTFVGSSNKRRIFFHSTFKAFIESLEDVIFKSWAYICFWAFQFSYMGLFPQELIIQLGDGTTIGEVTADAVGQIITNPLFSLACALSTFLIISCLLMIKSHVNIKKGWIGNV